MNCPECKHILSDNAAFCPWCGHRLAQAPTYDTYRYAAFISYCHKPADAKVAQKLQNALEAYRLPKGVTWSDSPSENPRKIGQVFRDETELPASDSLPHGIREALKQSQVLIVVCSPSTPASTWVTQEVELFASFHGRENILIALAEGEPAESMPPLLLERHVADGKTAEIKTEPTEPLAADFRPSSSKRFNNEMLRIVSGIIGCGYDTLYQREKTRKRNRMTLTSLCIAAVAAFLLVFACYFTEQTREHRHAAQIEESKSLAAQSQALFEEGDRYGAIQTALSALPSETDPERPVTDEATQALAKALEVYVDKNSFWRASYVIDMPFPIAEIGYAFPEGWFALLDNNFNLRTYDLITGKQQAAIAIPKELIQAAENNVEHLHIVTAKHSLAVYSDQGEQACFVCFNAYSGEERWREEGLFCHTAIAADEGNTLGVAAVTAGGVLNVALLDTQTSEPRGVQRIDDAHFGPFPTPTPCTFGKTAADFYIASQDDLIYVNIDTGKTARAKLPCDWATHIGAISGDTDKQGIVVVSESINEDDHRKHPYAISMFDEPASNSKLSSHMTKSSQDTILTPRWSHTGTYTIVNAGGGTNMSVFDGKPKVRSLVRLEEEALVCTAGANIDMFSIADGKELHRLAATTTVTGLNVYLNTKSDMLAVVSADGALTMLDPVNSMEGNLSGQLDFNFPCKISQANTVQCEQEYYVALGQSGDKDNRVVAYHTDFSGILSSYAEQVNNPDTHLPDLDKDSYTTEELIALAHEILA